MTQSFDELIGTADRPVLVDFWAEWCGPCRTVSPTIERIAKEYTGRLITIKVNVDKRPNIAGRYQVQSIPTIMMFWQGEPVMRLVGAQSYEQIKQQVDLKLPRA